MGEVSGALPPLTAPEALNDGHQLDGFDSGEAGLDAWLIRKARANQARGASRTYVLCRGEAVVGFYALAAGSVSHDHLPRKAKANMPDPIPVIVLGRLAIASAEQGRGLGRALLRDALLRIASVAGEVGIAAVLVHALNERAKAFYLNCGFSVSPIEPLTLVARIKDIRAALGEV